MKTYDHQIMARLLWVHAHEDREGRLARAGRRLVDLLSGSLLAARDLPDVATELHSALDQPIQGNYLATCYAMDPATYEAEALTFIYEHARTAAYPHESRIDVEAWVAQRMAELEGRAA